MGILLSDISDHFPVMVGVGNTWVNSKEPLCVKSRKFTQGTYTNMEHWLNQVDWRFLYDMETDYAYSEFIKKLNECIDIMAPRENFLKLLLLFHIIM